MRKVTQQRISLNGRQVRYRLVCSPVARKLRVRVGVNGVEVLQPATRPRADVSAFLKSNEQWVIGQLARVERLRGLRRKTGARKREILFRGQPTRIKTKHDPTWRGANRVTHEGDCIRIVHGKSGVSPSKSLENWLRRQARRDIEVCLARRSKEMKQKYGRLYIRAQRTKWGGCSRRRNLSFNWRLVCAPPAALDYIVVHELAHLAEPYHSPKFWLIVRSFCSNHEHHKTWLHDHQEALMSNRKT